jgi:hypothetical protein
MEWITDPSTGVYFFDDFFSYHTTETWTSTLTDTGTSAITTGLGGWLSLVPSDGTVADEDEAYAYGTSAAFQVQAGKDIWFEAEISYAEANTDDINIIVGLSSIGTANLLVDVGAGPALNFDGLCFFKVDGGTTYSIINSLAATQTIVATGVTRVVSTPVRLGIRTYSNNLATYFVNGVQVTSSGLTLPTAAMRPVLGVKNGGANNENLTCNWVRAFQVR